VSNGADIDVWFVAFENFWHDGSSSRRLEGLGSRYFRIGKWSRGKGDGKCLFDGESRVF
jgi:hypothetical protein